MKWTAAAGRALSHAAWRFLLIFKAEIVADHGVCLACSYMRGGALLATGERPFPALVRLLMCGQIRALP